MGSEPEAEASTGRRAVVAQAITRLNIGGPARHVLDLVAGLGDRYAMCVVTGTAPTVEGELSTDSVEVQRVPLVRALAPHRDAAAFVHTRRLLRERRVEVVHSHMAKAGTVARLAAASLHPRPLTVHTFHGHVLAGYFGRRAERAFLQVERHLARRTDLLLAVSDEIRDQLLDLGVGSASQFQVLPLGLDLDPYLAVDGPSSSLRTRLGLDLETPLVAVLARLVPIKDHQTLLSAMADVPGAHLVVLGDGELRSDLEALATQPGLRGRVHFLGWWSDIPGALADVDVVVLASRNEGTPMSLIEAAAAARPVVATDVGGVAQIVRHGHTGFLVPPGDADALAERLRQLLDDPQLRSELGQRARVHVTQAFALEPFLEHTAAIYEQLLARGR